MPEKKRSDGDRRFFLLYFVTRHSFRPGTLSHAASSTSREQGFHTLFTEAKPAAQGRVPGRGLALHGFRGEIGEGHLAGFLVAAMVIRNVYGIAFLVFEQQRL